MRNHFQSVYASSKLQQSEWDVSCFSKIQKNQMIGFLHVKHCHSSYKKKILMPFASEIIQFNTKVTVKDVLYLPEEKGWLFKTNKMTNEFIHTHKKNTNLFDVLMKFDSDIWMNRSDYISYCDEINILDLFNKK